MLFSMRAKPWLPILNCRKNWRWLTAAVARLMDAYGENIEAFMKDTVQSWDADTLVQKLEAEVGADLQFIRINGTLVGGGVGLLIHLVELWI